MKGTNGWKRKKEDECNTVTSPPHIEQPAAYAIVNLNANHTERDPTVHKAASLI